MTLLHLTFSKRCFYNFSQPLILDNINRHQFVGRVGEFSVWESVGILCLTFCHFTYLADPLSLDCELLRLLFELDLDCDLSADLDFFFFFFRRLLACDAVGDEAGIDDFGFSKPSFPEVSENCRPCPAHFAPRL